MKYRSSVIVQRLAEKLFIIISLLFFTGALVPFVSDQNLFYPIVQVTPYAIQAVTILLIVTRWKRVLRIVIRENLLWAVMGIALASVFWSDVPMVTLGRVIPLLQVTVFGVYFAGCYSLKEQLWLLAWALGIAALLSLVFGLALPQYGVVGGGFIANTEDVVHTEAWRGVYVHKTYLGTIMSLSAMVFLLFATSSRRYRWVAWAGFGLSFGLILLSTTKAALAICLTILALIPLYRALRWNYTLAVPFFITVVLVGGGMVTLFLGNAENILSFIGKDITLSGRTELWSPLIDKIWQRPWLGYGYDVFWLGGWEGEPADIWRTLRYGFEPPHAHNGALELLLDSGLLGLSVFTLSFLAVCLRAVIWIRLLKTAEGLVPLVYLTFMVMTNITESLLMRSDIFWILYVAVTLSMHNRSVNLAEFNAFWQQKVKGCVFPVKS